LERKDEFASVVRNHTFERSRSIPALESHANSLGTIDELNVMLNEAGPQGLYGPGGYGLPIFKLGYCP
jgi:hypothetical protein